jgi:hypothetical protein
MLIMIPILRRHETSGLFLSPCRDWICGPIVSREPTNVVESASQSVANQLPVLYGYINANRQRRIPCASQTRNRKTTLPTNPQKNLQKPKFPRPLSFHPSPNSKIPLPNHKTQSPRPTTRWVELLKSLSLSIQCTTTSPSVRFYIHRLSAI